MSNYSPPPPQGGYYPQEPLRHPQSTTILVLGILGVVLCYPIGIIAWVMGNRALADIDSSGQVYADRGMVKAGQILGIIGTAIMVAFVVIFGILAAVVGLGAIFSGLGTETP